MWLEALDFPMNTERLSEIFSLLLAVGGNVFLAGLFAAALRSPFAYAEFIFKTGILIFIIEFLSIHASGMVMGSGRTWGGLGLRLGLVTFYGIFAAAWGFITGNLLLPAYLLFGTLAKVFGRQASHRPAMTALLTLLLIASVAFVAFTGTFLQALFPFPPELAAKKPAGAGGLFIDAPQTLLIWGVLYYTLVSVFEVFAFVKERRRPLLPSSFQHS